MDDRARPEEHHQQRHRPTKRRPRSRSHSQLDHNQDLLWSPPGSQLSLEALHRRDCRQYACRCRRHTVSVIKVSEARNQKLYWFDSRSVQDKVLLKGPNGAEGRHERGGGGSGGGGGEESEGYYRRLLRAVDGALGTWLKRYVEGLGGYGAGSSSGIKMLAPPGQQPMVVARKPPVTSGGSRRRLLKEGCYCHYHPGPLAADACNAEFLKRVVSSSRNEDPGVTDEEDLEDLEALTPRWMVSALFKCRVLPYYSTTPLM